MWWRRDRSLVAPALTLRRLHQRSESRPHTGDVGVADRSIEVGTVGRRVQRLVQGLEDVVDVVGGGLRVVHRAVEIGVGRAGIHVSKRAVLGGAPRHEEEAPLVASDRDDDGDVVAHQRPRQRDVDALGRSDRVGIATFVERPHVVGPHAGRVDDRPRRDVEPLPIGFDDGPGHTAVDVAQLHQATPVGEDRPAGRCGPSDGERESCIVSGRVVVDETTAQLVEVGRRKMSGRLFGGHSSVQLADPPAAGQVVHPQRGAERLGDLARDHAVLGHDRQQEGEHLDHVRSVAHQSPTLVQRFVHEADVAVLQIAEAAVDELRALRRCAAGEVVALDQRRPQPTVRCIEGHSDARDPAADHQHVERFAAVERTRPQGVEHGGAVEWHRPLSRARHSDDDRSGTYGHHL